MFRFIVLLPIFLTFVFVSDVSADLILTIGTPADIGNDQDDPVGPFVAGESITMQVLGHLTAPIQPPLTSYTVTIDFGGDGDNISSSFSVPTFTSRIGGTLIADDSLAGALPIDFTLNWLGSAPISVDAANPTTLFEINFASSPTTLPGIYDVNFGDDDGSNALSAFTANGANFTAENMRRDNGQFEIVAIPEPSLSILLFASGCAVIMTRRRH